MLRYLATRLLYLVPVVWLVVSVVFLLIHLVPGDPIQQMLGEGATSADIQAARHAYGLDVPLGQQYVNYWKGVLSCGVIKFKPGNGWWPFGVSEHCDLGRSFRFDQPVATVVLQRYPSTLQLTVASMLVALLISIPAGVRSARRRNRWDDRLLSFVSLWGLSFPNFALGPILILFFAIRLGLLPVSGSGTLAHLVLPAITLGGALAAILTRMVRTAMLEELGQDYIRTARAKGLSENAVVYKHALRNALVPVLTVVGLQFGALLAGAIVTETIFSWPGIGRLTITAIGSRDYYLVQGCILMIGLTYVAVNFMTDLLYSFANPRIRA
jgi:ABC-type dipeptide/oligopeptide/nickel transport system permease component